MKNRNKSKRSGIIWMTAGLLLLAAALFLTIWNLWQERRAGEAAYEISEAMLEAEPQMAASLAPAGAADDAPLVVKGDAVPDYVRFPGMEMPTVEIDGRDYIGLLEIPALELLLPIISEWSYDNLKLVPCRYSGSMYSGDLVIAGHNYRSQFASLIDLQPGDGVIFTDADGNVFSCQVAETEILGPTDIEAMESGDWDLTLFTCTVGGQNRVAVRCILEDS